MDERAHRRNPQVFCPLYCFESSVMDRKPASSDDDGISAVIKFDKFIKRESISKSGKAVGSLPCEDTYRSLVESNT